MIFNINSTTFGGAVRNGDLIAICNIVEHLRKISKDTTIQFYMNSDAVNSSDYVQEFFIFLKTKTDYFSEIPGDVIIPWKKVNIWDFRDISGDLVKIQNNEEKQKKIVVFPVIDAPYNVYRNWPVETFWKILGEYSTPKYKDYEKIVCISPNLKVNVIPDWKISTDFMTNIHHIMTAETFIGGDTGTSHFAWALDNGPQNLVYYISGRGLLHCLPFYLLEGKGKVIKYWLNTEGSSFNE